MGRARRRLLPARPANRPTEPVAGGEQASASSLGSVIREGIEVECRVIPLDAEGARTAGRSARDRTRDSSSPSGTRPAGPRSRRATRRPGWWRGRPAPRQQHPRDGREKLESLINGSLFTPPDLDLNTFYAVTLNHNATITVVDPLFGFGGTKLLALVPLAAAGVRLGLGPDGRSIFVAMPDVQPGRGGRHRSPGRSPPPLPGASVPGGWPSSPTAITSGSPAARPVRTTGASPSLTTADARIAARIRTGQGASDLAFSDDSRFAFVANSRSMAPYRSSTSHASARWRRSGPAAGPADRLLVARGPRLCDRPDGRHRLASSTRRDRRVADRIEIEPGIGAIRFTPDGAAAFVVNPERNMVYVIDPSTNRVVQRAKVEQGPDRVSFSSDFAYVRHRGSINVVMITLEERGTRRDAARR